MIWSRKRGLKNADDSAKAVEDANKNLNRIRSRNGKVNEVSQALRDLRENDEFTDQILAAMRGQ